MHLETEEKNIRCFNLKVFNSGNKRQESGQARRHSNKVNHSCVSGVCRNRCR